MLRTRDNKAQSTLEYAVVIAVVIGAMIAIQYYVKRGVQGRLRSSIDNVGEQYSAGHTTSTIITEYATAKDVEQTHETVGLKADGSVDTKSTGISNTVVMAAPTVHKHSDTASGGADEKITKTLSSETVYAP